MPRPLWRWITLKFQMHWQTLLVTIFPYSYLIKCKLIFLLHVRFRFWRRAVAVEERKKDEKLFQCSLEREERASENQMLVASRHLVSMREKITFHSSFWSANRRQLFSVRCTESDGWAPFDRCSIRFTKVNSFFVCSLTWKLTGKFCTRESTVRSSRRFLLLPSHRIWSSFFSHKICSSEKRQVTLRWCADVTWRNRQRRKRTSRPDVSVKSTKTSIVVVLQLLFSLLLLFSILRIFLV